MIQAPGEAKSTSSQPGISRRNLAACLGIGLGAVAAGLSAPTRAHAKDKEKDKDKDKDKDGQCFVRGTRILTPDGEVEIENMQSGDLVMTATGNAKPIKWIGHRAISAEELRKPGASGPVKVQRFALSDAAPHCDLYLSAAHAVFVDGVLVPVGDLVNGRTITRCPPPEVGALEYYHIELEDHDVILAEGAPCETLLVASAEALLFDNGAARAHTAPMACVAENVGLSGGRSHLKSRLRSAVSPIIDRRTRFDLLRDRLEERALKWPRAA